MILSLIDSEPEYVKAVAEFTDLEVDSMTLAKKYTVLERLCEVLT